MDAERAATFVQQWVTDWNAHDLEALLSHYAEDAVFTSPVAVRVVDGSDGVLVGKRELRAYWARGLELIPDLRFEVIEHYVGVDTLVINYRNQRGGVVCEVLSFDGPLVTAGHGTYLAADGPNPAGVKPSDEAS